VNLVFFILDIIPNSEIMFLVIYGLNREKSELVFYSKNEVKFLKHPVFLIDVWTALKLIVVWLI